MTEELRRRRDELLALIKKGASQQDILMANRYLFAALRKTLEGGSLQEKKEAAEIFWSAMQAMMKLSKESAEEMQKKGHMTDQLRQAFAFNEKMWENMQATLAKETIVPKQQEEDVDISRFLHKEESD